MDSKKPLPIAGTVIYAVVFLSILIFSIALGGTRALTGVIAGVGLFFVPTIGKQIKWVHGLWILLVSVVFFGIGFVSSGRDWSKFIEMLVHGGDPPYILTIASSLGVFGSLAVVMGAVRQIRK